MEESIRQQSKGVTGYLPLGLFPSDFPFQQGHSTIQGWEGNPWRIDRYPYFYSEAKPYRLITDGL